MPDAGKEARGACDIRTIVVLETVAFNTTEHRPYFINEGCFGDDLARWMISRLRENGIDTDDEPQPEDFGWYFGFRIPSGRFTFVIGYRPGLPDGTAGQFIGNIERDCGFIASLFGGRSRGIPRHAVETIHSVFRGAPGIASVSWHMQSDFDRGNETRGSASP